MAVRDLSDTADQVLEALLRLRPAGERSFERLVADLLADLTEMPFRLSRAGDQGGVDALSAAGVGLEMKRYAPGRDLNERDLLGEMHQAADSKRDLQVWGLATTAEVSAQLQLQLSRTARTLGVGLLIIDGPGGHPLPVAGIVALASVSPERLLKAIQDEEWLDPKKDAPPSTEDGLKKNRLAEEAANRFKAHAADHERAWQSEIFPQELVDSLEPARFASWVELVISAGSKGEMLWTGLLQAMFRRALREGGSSARELFILCYPFTRGGSLRGVRFVANGLHWTLHHLADPEMDDQKSRELVTELVLDCRNDLELFEVALAAHLGQTNRIEELVEEWLDDSDIEIRGRGVRLAGWLTGFRDRLEALQRGDPSLYVRRLTGTAIETEARDRWAQYWFRIFVSGEPLEKRWGAGQLFVECADRRMECWTVQELESVSRTRTRGEAFLLLEAARREIEKRERKLKETFLGVKVRDLENLCHPWRPHGTWRRLEPRA